MDGHRDTYEPKRFRKLSIHIGRQRPDKVDQVRFYHQALSKDCETCNFGRSGAKMMDIF